MLHLSQLEQDHTAGQYRQLIETMVDIKNLAIARMLGILITEE